MTDNDNIEPQNAIDPTVSLESPSQDVMIFEGVFGLKQFGQVSEAKGTIRFTWYPLRRLVFSGEIAAGSDHPMDHLHPLELLINGKSVGTGHLYHRHWNENKTCVFEGHSFHLVFGPSDVPVTELHFSIPNMREFYGALIGDHEGQKLQDGRFFFEDENYKVIIDKALDFKEIWQALRTKGGFMITYGGHIVAKKKAFLISDMEDYSYAVAHFLYFLSGQRTAPLFLKSVQKECDQLLDVRAHDIQPYKLTYCWSDFQYFDDLSLVWLRFRALWLDKGDRDFLITLLHWYVEANAGTAYIDGSIILAQAAIELIFNWLIVEKKALLTKKAAKKLNADEKIRKLLVLLNEDKAIPARFSELAQLPNITDGPHAFVAIRNALVHADEHKRVQFLMSVKGEAKYQALKLGIAYIEASLLYILEYKGRYFHTALGQNKELI